VEVSVAEVAAATAKIDLLLELPACRRLLAGPSCACGTLAARV